MDYTLLLQLALALVFGGLLGYEREQAGKEAGLRTHIILSVAACSLIIASIDYNMGNIDRVIQGIITGMGFIGAGTIISNQDKVKGITTAASLWTSTIIGVIIGLELYFLGIILSVIIFLVLKLWSVEKTIQNNDPVRKSNKKSLLSNR